MKRIGAMIAGLLLSLPILLHADDCSQIQSILAGYDTKLSNLLSEKNAALAATTDPNAVQAINQSYDTQAAQINAQKAALQSQCQGPTGGGSTGGGATGGGTTGGGTTGGGGTTSNACNSTLEAYYQANIGLARYHSTTLDGMMVAKAQELGCPIDAWRLFHQSGGATVTGGGNGATTGTTTPTTKVRTGRPVRK